MDGILELIGDGIVPSERIEKLQRAVRLLYGRLEREYSAKEQSEFLPLAELAAQHGCSTATLRDQITKVLGGGVVYKVGCTLGLRRVNWIRFHERKEVGA